MDICAHVRAGFRGGQQNMLDALELEFQESMSLLVWDEGSGATGGCDPSCECCGIARPTLQPEDFPSLKQNMLMQNILAHYYQPVLRPIRGLSVVVPSFHSDLVQNCVLPIC